MNEGKGGKHGWRVFVKEVGVKGKKSRNEAKELRREEEVWEENRILRGEKTMDEEMTVKRDKEIM